VGWRENLRDASFRGVRYVVEERGLGTGRRTVLHEYPQRDEPYSEDLGRRARTISQSAFVVGDDYMTARDELLAACEEAGAGELIDPWEGVLSVVCVRCQLRENLQEGAFARFTLTFEEAGVNVAPVAETDTAWAVTDTASSAAASSVTTFGATYSTSTRPSYLAGLSQVVLGDVADGLETAERLARGGLEPAAEVFRDLANFREDIVALSYTPASLGTEIDRLTGSVADLATDPNDRIDRMLELAETLVDLEPQTTSTPARIQAGVNQEAIVSLQRRAAIARAAAAVPDVEFASYEEAQDVRGRVLEALDVELLAAGEFYTDDTYLELRALYAAVADDIQARASTLARLSRFTPPATMPALAIAQHLYGDATRDEELIARNGIPHPGFTPGGSALQVLTDA
jgi:prophage DNA circulation protein